MAMPDFLKWPVLPRCRSERISVFLSSQKIQRSVDNKNVLFKIVCGMNAAIISKGKLDQL